MVFKNLIIKLIAFYFIIVGLSQLLGALYFAGYNVPSFIFISDTLSTRGIYSLFGMSTPPSILLWVVLAIGLFTGYQLLRQTKIGLYLAISLPLIGLIFTATKTVSFPTILSYVQWIFSGLISSNFLYSLSDLLNIFISIYLFINRKMFNGVIKLWCNDGSINQSPQTVEQSLQQSTPTNISHNSKNLIFVLCAIFILIVISGVIYLILPKNSDRSKQSTISEDQTSWKTYVTRDGNFQFKVPGDTRVSETLSTDFKPDHMVFKNYGSADSSIFLEIYNQQGRYWVNVSDITFFSQKNSANDESLDEFAQIEGLLKVNQEKQTVSISGVPGYKFKLNSYNNPGPVVIVKINNKFIEFENHINKEFDQILSTFKFIGQSQTDTSSWKTYTDPTYGFSITYPAKGVIILGMPEIECGKAIKKDMDKIVIDNFFGVDIKNWQGTIQEYINSIKNFHPSVTPYEIKLIEIMNSGSDEAFEIKSAGNMDIDSIISIYKRNNKLFILRYLQNPGNEGGCLFPGPRSVYGKWDIPTSFKFITVSPTGGDQNQTADTSNWKVYTSIQLPNNSFKPYMIKYPLDWNMKLDRDPNNTYDVFSLEKDKYVLKILQAAMGGGQCIFDGDIPVEGPMADIRGKEYQVLNSNLGILRRYQSVARDGKIIYDFCAKNKNNSFQVLFGTPTSIGTISYEIPVFYDKSIISEMDKIVSTLKEASN